MDEQQQQDHAAMQEAQAHNDAVQQAEEQKMVQAHQQQQQSTSLADKPKWKTYQGDTLADDIANVALYPFNAIAAETTKNIARGLYLSGAANTFGKVTLKDVAVIEDMM